MTTPSGASVAKRSLTRRTVVLLFSTSLLWLAFNAAALLRYPTVVSDESLVGLVAYRLTDTGHLPSVSQYDPFGVYPFRLYLTGLAHWFELVGVGLVQARAFSLLAGLVAGWLLFFLARKLYDERIGALATTIFWFTPRVFWTSHFVRPEMWVAAANIGGLLAGWWLIQRPSRLRALLAGFLSVAILDIYLSAISTTLTVGLLTLLWLARHRKGGVILALACGALLGVAYYVLVQFGADWHTSMTHWQYWLTRGRIIGPEAGLLRRLLAVPSVLSEEYLRYSVIGWLEAAAFAVTAALVARRRSMSDVYVLVAAAVALSVYGLAFASPWHALDAVPMPALIVAAGLMAGADRLDSAWPPTWPRLLPSTTTLAWLLAVPLLFGYLGLSGYYLWANRDYDYFAYVRDLQSLTSSQATILGEGTWWWGFTNQPYWWDEALEDKGGATLDEARTIVDSAMHARQITTVFMDENLGLMALPSSNVAMRTVLAEYVAAHCVLRGTVTRIAYGIDMNGPGVKATRVYVCGESN